MSKKTIRTRNVARREVDRGRVVAWEVLRAVDEQDAYANLVLPGRLRAAGLRGRDAAFSTELTYGTLRGRGPYDAVLAACVDRPLAEVDPPLLDALRLGAHQLLGMRVPAHAGVAATVDVVRAEVGQGAAGFANAVLRRVAGKDLAAWLAEVAPDAEADPVGHLAVVHSHPVWIVRALQGALRTWGRDDAELPDLLAADNARPPVTLAALPGFADPATIVARAGEGAALGRWSPIAVTITGPPDGVPDVRAGRARVQDEGSQLVTLALAGAQIGAGADDVGSAQDGGQWLDLCAGPGGKAALLGAALADRNLPAARLVAVEVSEHRADLVRGSTSAVATRLDIEVRCADGRLVGQEEPAAYDRVLVDAPCTGLGALRRRPEARWRRTPADLATLGPLQRALLASALDAVRPGGLVAYVTCSPHPAETRLVVADALRKRDDVEQIDARPALVTASGGRLSADDLGVGPDVQLWPHVHGTDAMCLALLRRTR